MSFGGGGIAEAGGVSNSLDIKTGAITGRESFAADNGFHDVRRS